MKIAILSQNPALYSTRRLRKAGQEQGHDMRVINYLRCCLNITSRNLSIIYKGKKLESFDAIIPRIGVSATFYGTGVVRQFEMMNVVSLNDSQAISRSRDKLRSIQILAREGVGLPLTGFAQTIKDIDGLIDIVGGAPLIIKLLEGTQGMGVVLAQSDRSAKSAVKAFYGLNANILLQEFIQEAKGADLRCFVVGEKVIASMKRQGAKGEFRSNLHRGGKAHKIILSPEEKKTAITAARAMGLKVAGVDLLQSNHGSVVMEVNSSPGLKGIENVTGVDVAGKIINFIAKKAAEAEKNDYP